jgi:hypothetical protein
MAVVNTLAYYDTKIKAVNIFYSTGFWLLALVF